MAQRIRLRLTVAILALIGMAVPAARTPAADYDWDTLHHVYRVAVARPFFCTDAMRSKAGDAQERESAAARVAGRIAWNDEQMADQLRAKPQTMKTLLVDWQEATEQVAQQLADSLTRLPLPGRPIRQPSARIAIPDTRRGKSTVTPAQ